MNSYYNTVGIRRGQQSACKRSPYTWKRSHNMRELWGASSAPQQFQIYRLRVFTADFVLRRHLSQPPPHASNNHPKNNKIVKSVTHGLLPLGTVFCSCSLELLLLPGTQGLVLIRFLCLGEVMLELTTTSVSRGAAALALFLWRVTLVRDVGSSWKWDIRLFVERGSCDFLNVLGQK